MIGGKKTNDFLNERRCFELWADLGSLGKAREALVREGVAHPLTGKPASKMGVWNAAIRYMATYPEETYAYLDRAGYAWSSAEYYAYLLKNAQGRIPQEVYRVLEEKAEACQ